MKDRFTFQKNHYSSISSVSFTSLGSSIGSSVSGTKSASSSLFSSILSVSFTSSGSSIGSSVSDGGGSLSSSTLLHPINMMADRKTAVNSLNHFRFIFFPPFYRHLYSKLFSPFIIFLFYRL